MKASCKFNLIEIILTVAVIAFGVTVILGMLPRGLSATRAAGMESYTSEIIDQMAGFLQELGADGVTAEVASDSDTAFVSSFPSGGTLDTLLMNSYQKLSGYMEPYQSLPSSLSSDFAKTGTAGVFKAKEPAGAENYAKSVYLIVMGDNYRDGDGENETRIDFSGMLRVWKRPLKMNRIHLKSLDTDGSGANIHWKTGSTKLYRGAADSNFNAPEVTVPNGAVVCMELSYPLSLPYAQRTKRYYSFEVLK